MPIFTIEVAEVVVYRGRVEASTADEARAAAVQDLIANAGSGQLAFAEVADRTATIIDD